MSVAALLLLLVSVGLTGFGAWGLYTVPGRQRFDEMAGMIPFFAFWGGLVLGLIAIAWLCVIGARTRG